MVNVAVPVPSSACVIGDPLSTESVAFPVGIPAVELTVIVTEPFAL
jgi:hypothetical protein